MSRGLRRRTEPDDDDGGIDASAIAQQPAQLLRRILDDLEVHSGLHELSDPSVLGQSSPPSAIAIGPCFASGCLGHATQPELSSR